VLEGAAREALEEAGLVLDTKAMQLVYTTASVGFNASYGRTLNLVRLQFATRISEQEVTLSEEHDAYEWLTIDEVIARTNHPFQKMLLQYIKDNEIVKELWSTL
jgi:8-oxo-dGTP pyrophosphatase MutT (NUDIX family)